MGFSIATPPPPPSPWLQLWLQCDTRVLLNLPSAHQMSHFSEDNIWAEDGNTNVMECNMMPLVCKVFHVNRPTTESFTKSSLYGALLRAISKG